MDKLATVVFTGVSGQRYKFNVYPWDTNFKAIGAVYFITSYSQKADGEYEHHKIYIGQTHDLSERFDNHHKIDCFKRENANCICTFPENDEGRRREIEADLLASYYHTPCND